MAVLSDTWCCHIMCCNIRALFCKLCFLFEVFASHLADLARSSLHRIEPRAFTSVSRLCPTASVKTSRTALVSEMPSAEISKGTDMEGKPNVRRLLGSHSSFVRFVRFWPFANLGQQPPLP